MLIFMYATLYITFNKKPEKNWEAYSRSFTIIAVDGFTSQHYENKYGRKFAVGNLDPPKPGEPMRKIII